MDVSMSVTFCTCRHGAAYFVRCSLVELRNRAEIDKLAVERLRWASA